MSPPERPLVSVVMPAYNEEEFIEEAIRSVLRQSYGEVELIVVDDGSTDETVAKAAEYQNELQLLTSAHQGASHARNAGAAAATGEYLVFLDADDVLGSAAIGGLVRSQESAASRQTISVCDWSFLVQNDLGEWVMKTAESAVDPHSEDPLAAWLSGSFYPPCAVMWPRGLFEDVDGWDESLVSNQDGDLAMRALIAGARIVNSETGRSFYRRHDGQNRISDRRDPEAFRSRWKVLRRVEAALEETGRLSSYRVLLGQAYHGLAKNFYRVDSDLAGRCERRGIDLAGSKSVVGSKLHCFLYRTIGLAGKERLRTLLGGIVR